MIPNAGTKNMKKITEIAEILGAEIFNAGDAEREVSGGYAGDFLSFVMGKAPVDCAWFTVMANINVCAVATLADVGAVILCEGVTPDNNLLEKARKHNINLLGTKYDVYNAVKIFAAHEN